MDTEFCAMDEGSQEEDQCCENSIYQLMCNRSAKISLLVAAAGGRKEVVEVEGNIRVGDICREFIALATFLIGGQKTRPRAATDEPPTNQPNHYFLSLPVPRLSFQTTIKVSPPQTTFLSTTTTIRR